MKLKIRQEDIVTVVGSCLFIVVALVIILAMVANSFNTYRACTHKGGIPVRGMFYDWNCIESTEIKSSGIVGWLP